jgi:hypothetical protein
MIYGARPIQNGSYIKYYSYWDCEQKCMVVTDDYNEYRTHFERIRFGGNNGIHLGFPKHDPPLQIDPNL